MKLGVLNIVFMAFNEKVSTFIRVKGGCGVAVDQGPVQVAMAAVDQKSRG